MSKRHDLTVEPRQAGKHFSRTYRTQKKIPAVIYGSLEKNQNVILEENAVLKFNTRAYENALFTLKSADSKLNGVVVLMKDVVVHPLSRRPEHVDLFALDLKKPVRISVEVRVEGKPIGIADGGLLNVVTRQIEIECLPADIPDGFSVDVSGLGVGDALHVSDVKVPNTVKVLSSPDLTIAVVNLFVEEVTAPTVEAAATPAAGAAATPGAGAAATPAAGAAATPAAGAKKDAPKK